MSDILLLTSSIDEGVMDWWAFQGENTYQAAQYIIRNAWEYQELFRDLRVYPDDIQSPDKLLKRIEDSHVDGDSESGLQFHRITSKDIAIVGEEPLEPPTFPPGQNDPDIPKFHFLEHSENDLKKYVEIKGNYVKDPAWAQPENLPELTDEERQEFSRFTERLRPRLRPPSLLNPPTRWARTIYPLLFMAERDDVIASAETIMVAQYPTFELHGVIEGMLSHDRYGDGHPTAPYHLIVMPAKRGLDRRKLPESLMLQLLAAARLNWEHSKHEPQQVFGCYIIGSGWNFVRAEVSGLDSERPAAQIEHSYSYYDVTHDPELLLRLIKSTTCQQADKEEGDHD